MCKILSQSQFQNLDENKLKFWILMSKLFLNFESWRQNYSYNGFMPQLLLGKPPVLAYFEYCSTDPGQQSLHQDRLIHSLYTGGYRAGSGVRGMAGIAVFKISAGPRTRTGTIWVGPQIFPSSSYINFGKIVLQFGKFQILFWRLVLPLVWLVYI